MSIFRTERRVVIVDDSRTIQAMLDNAFSQRKEFCVVGFASDGTSAAEMIRRLMPDVVTIDLCMPQLDGESLLGLIRDLTSVCKIVVSDESLADPLFTSKLIDAGAAACLGKSDVARDPAEFFKKINAAADLVNTRRQTYASNFAGPVHALPVAAHFGDRETVPAYPVPADEAQRLRFMQLKNLCNASRERHFDLVTKHVAKVTAFPVCLLTFIDRDTQWVKSAYGLDVESTPRDVAFCNYTISRGEAFTVANASSDERFARNPLVSGAPHIRSYTGYPVIAGNGVVIGTLCIIDARVRTVSKHVHDELAGMSEIVAEMIEQRPPIAA